MKRVAGHIVFTLIVIISQNAGAQSIYEFDYGFGSVIAHKNTLSHLVLSHPNYYQFTVLKPSDTSRIWKRRFNYPDQGIGLIVQDFKNNLLGQTVGVNYHTTFYLRDRNKAGQFLLNMGLGLSYNTRPFDMENNNKNSVISSSIIYNQVITLNYQWQFSDNWFLKTGLGFTHFSNASFRQPNNGINSAFLNFGIKHHKTGNSLTYPKPQKPALPDVRKINYGITGKVGFHEPYPGLGTHVVYEINPFVSKQYFPMGNINAGIDFTFSQADKVYAEYLYVSKVENPERILENHNRIGLYLGYEQVFNNISCEADLGYYLYKKLDDTYTNMYENIKIKYKIKNTKFKVGLGLKLHLIKANFASLDLQYQCF